MSWIRRSNCSWTREQWNSSLHTHPWVFMDASSACIPKASLMVGSIWKSIRLGDWATSIDLTDVYFHILSSRSKVAPVCLEESGFSVPDPSLWSALGPMGLHSKGEKVGFSSTDDWLILAQSQKLSLTLNNEFLFLYIARYPSLQ